MPATHVSGQRYAYLFDHERDKPVIHTSSLCAGTVTSDMTESAAVEEVLDGNMVPCDNCCTDFPVELHDCEATEIPLERGGWYNIGTCKATLKPHVDVDELHPKVYNVLARRGFRLE